MLRIITFDFADDSELNLEGSVAGINYCYLAGKRKDIKSGRINIIVHNGQQRDIEVVGLNDQVAHYHLYTDLQAFKSNDRNTRIKMLYEMIFYVIDYLCETQNLDKAFYDDIKSEIVRKNYSFEVILFPAVKNRSKTLSAEFVLELDPIMADLRVNIYGMDGILAKTIKVFQAFPTHFLYKRFFDKGAWKSDEIYSIRDTEKEIFFDCNAVEGNVNIRFEPKVNTVGELNDLLMGARFDTPWEERFKLLQIPRTS